MRQLLKSNNRNKRSSKSLGLHPGGAGTAIILSALLFSFSLSLVAGSLFLQPQGSKAVTGLGLAGTATMTLSSSSGTVNMAVTPSASGALASSSHNITAATNVPTGYSLSLAAAAAPALTPSSGTFTAPVALANNTWGYAVPGLGGFDASYAAPTPSGTSKWANPNIAATIKNTNTSTASDTTTIYYGTKADLNLASGSYANTVRYTATANLNNIPTPSILSITPTVGTTAGGTAIAIVGTGFTVNDQSVTTAVTIGGVACGGVSISSNTPATGKDTIYCNTPAHPTAEAVNVAVTTWKSTATSANAYTYAAPTPTITAPTASQIFNAGTTSTTLTVTTDMPGICYYGTAANPTTQMTAIGGATYSVSITGLASQSTNTRYVRCQAASGHSYSADKSVTFYVRAATPAMPTLSPENGGGAATGTTTITVTSSGAVCTWGTSSGSVANASGTARTTTEGTNTLYYSCVTGSGNTASVARTGSWSYTGYAPIAMQAVTTEACTTTRRLVYDARDNRSYWMQRLADGKCWMLTNLAYGGGGTNAYGDAKTITNSNTLDYTKPYYMIPTGSNVTSGTTNPSTSTNGTGQYGYLYNWCAAMGNQSSTAACMNATTPAPNTSISICPSGWRLPTGGTGGEFQALNNTVNSTSGDSGLRSAWLAMYSGFWYTNFADQGSGGYYWSSTQFSAEDSYNLRIFSNYVYPVRSDGNKGRGHAIRCVLQEEPAQTGDNIQDVTINTCPATRTRVVDARDNKTYWVQKLADGKCWMLTNLAYAGGGTNTYDDTKTLTAGTTYDYAPAQYYIPTGSNVTSGTTNPSTSTNGTGQYGYLYNWCAAMGNQSSTSACANATTPALNTSISICPAGWRLPTGGSGGEFQAMTSAENSAAGSTALRSAWLAMYSGYWYNGFRNQGSGGYYWSSTQYSATDGYDLLFGSGSVSPADYYNKRFGFAVRCVGV